MYPKLASNLVCSRWPWTDSLTSIPPSCWDYNCVLFYVVLGMEALALCRLARYSTNWATLPPPHCRCHLLSTDRNGLKAELRWLRQKAGRPQVQGHPGSSLELQIYETVKTWLRNWKNKNYILEAFCINGDRLITFLWLLKVSINEKKLQIFHYVLFVTNMGLFWGSINLSPTV